MKLVLEDMTPAQRQKYEHQKSPLHPWTPHTDDRTGFAICNICVERKLPWAQNKSVHSAYEIREEIDFPWEN